MFYETALAMALLSSNCEFEPTESQWPYTAIALQQLALRLEILDHRESSYILVKKQDFHSDINLLRRRYAEFSNVPRIADSFRMPCRGFVNEMLAFNRSYRQHLLDRKRLEVDRDDVISNTIYENDLLYQIWDAVRDSQCEFYYVTVRRTALRRIRNIIGEERYLSCDFPPVVPVWRFNSVND